MWHKLGYLVASLMAAGGLFLGTAAGAAALENAYGFAYDSNNAAYSAIETASPAIRDGNFSYMRVGGQRIISGNVYYVEIGWLKSASNPTPTSYWTYRNINGFVDSGYGGVPGCCGVGYNYQVSDVGSGQWSLYFNNLSSPVTTVWTDFDAADDYFSGGETSSTQNAMGVSGNDNVKYLQNGNWVCACDWQPNITNSIYHVVGLNQSGWQVYGNN